jgi:hypothetical protein
MTADDTYMTLPNFLEYPMIFYPQERIAIFIDGANLYSAARGLGFDFLISFVQKGG